MCFAWKIISLGGFIMILNLLFIETMFELEFCAALHIKIKNDFVLTLKDIVIQRGIFREKLI